MENPITITMPVDHFNQLVVYGSVMTIIGSIYKDGPIKIEYLLDGIETLVVTEVRITFNGVSNEAKTE